MHTKKQTWNIDQPTAPTKLFGWISLLVGNGFVLENLEQWNASWVRQSHLAHRHMYRLMTLMVIWWWSLILILTWAVFGLVPIQCVEPLPRGLCAKLKIIRCLFESFRESLGSFGEIDLSSLFHTELQSGRALLTVVLQPHKPSRQKFVIYIQ